MNHDQPGLTIQLEGVVVNRRSIIFPEKVSLPPSGGGFEVVVSVNHPHTFFLAPVGRHKGWVSRSMFG